MNNKYKIKYIEIAIIPSSEPGTKPININPTWLIVL